MVAVPAPIIEIVFPFMVATLVLLEAKVIAPVAAEVGTTKLNEASPKFLVTAVMALNVATALLTVIVVVTLLGS